MRDVQDQGDCGSCWAFASSTVLRAHSELYQQDRTFSVQQIVSCTPNPGKCGGSGGCDGATAELAFDYVQKVALADARENRYTGRNGRCPSDRVLAGASQASTVSFLDALRDTLHLSSHRPSRASPKSVAALAAAADNTAGARSIGMRSWRKLPENQLAPLLMALYEQGPVAVSVAASSSWNHYYRGVLDVCERDAIVNHAVTLIGYGEANRVKYWHIQNSWGPEWGEHGHVRLLRRDDQEEGAFCGVDRKPEQGTGCRGGPSEVTVCGACGILYDSVVPQFDLSPEGLLSRKPGARTVTSMTQLNASLSSSFGA
jgi:cathepsin L